MDPLHTLGRFLIAALSKSTRVSYEVIPSWVTLSTEASELSFMLVEALSQERNVALVVTIVNNSNYLIVRRLKLLNHCLFHSPLLETQSYRYHLNLKQYCHWKIRFPTVPASTVPQKFIDFPKVQNG